ncbi:MAG TPA: chitosanase [Labilithrix sp.]
MRRLVIGIVAAFAVACSGSTTEDASGGESDVTTGKPPASTPPGTATPGATPSSTPADGMNALAKHKAEMLTSVWENGTTVLQYGYCENIKDGRGYTSGRAGFCSGTGDAFLVVKCAGASSPMAKYLPALDKLDQTYESTGKDQASTTTLDAVGKYCADWTASAADDGFRACQDQVVSQLYFEPALAQAKSQGLTTALTKAELYDAEINHGDDGVADLVKQATADVGAVAGTRTIDQESAWLQAFLARRLAVLKADPTWAQAVDRIATYEAARRAKNFDLSQKLETNAKASALYPGQKLQDSGYPDCVIEPAGGVSGESVCTHP